MAEVHHFAYGWINPAVAFVMSVLGSLLGLVLAARAREMQGRGRLRWLMLAAVAIGGTGIWLMHLMAMLGFDVPNSVVRYDLPLTLLSLVFAVVIVALGLFVVGTGRRRAWKILLAGAFTGIGVAAMHYTGMAAMHVAGVVTYDQQRVWLSVAIAVVTATVALWFSVTIRGPRATAGAAVLMAVAASSTHYIGMSAVRVELADVESTVPGVSPFMLLMPISLLACVVISFLAYATVGSSVRQENAREEAVLASIRATYAATVVPGDRPPVPPARLAVPSARPSTPIARPLRPVPQPIRASVSLRGR